MQNFVKPGKVMTFTAPDGGVVSGTAYLIGSLLVVACASADAGAEFEGMAEGVFTLPKPGSQEWTEGQKIYWDNSAAAGGGQVCTTDATKGQLVGVAAAAVTDAAGNTTGQVRLNGNAPATSEGPQATIAAIAASTYTPAIDDAAVVASADAQGDIEPAAAGACEGDGSPSAANVDTAIATAVAPLTANDATLAVALKQVRADVEAIRTTVAAIRTALIAAGIIASS
jgi:predicted RecA/RadA family phage recombinase